MQRICERSAALGAMCFAFACRQAICCSPPAVMEAFISTKQPTAAAVKKFAGHRDWVYTVAEHAGRKRLASGSYDGEVRIWNAEDGSTAAAFPAVPKTQTVAAAGN
jgi:WD40 repeat protein